MKNRTHIRSSATAGISASLMLAASLAATPAPAADDHFALARSVPAADASVPAPTELQLWFTEPPEAGTLAVRLTNARGELIETSPPQAAETDAKEVHVAVAGSVPAGRYAVNWRGIGDDGHAVEGSFGFTVHGQ
jgi:methionine-rich copper-binding protein CopC